MLPYAFLRPVDLKCPHCERREVSLRGTALVGSRHTCPHCKKSYVIGEKTLAKRRSASEK